MTRPAEDYHFDESAYDRPNDNWVCGWSREGRPCPIGPSGGGRCQAEQICIPYLKQDRWHCNRPSAWGGKCQGGPLPDGSCSHPFPTCQPLRSLMARRRALTIAVGALTVGVLLIALGSGGAGRFASPGALAAAHGHVEENCAACHSAADADASDWALLAVRGGNGLADSGLCRGCHVMDADAFAPHSVTPADLAETTERVIADASGSGKQTGRGPRDLLVDLVPDVQTEHGELACATCHREHHGRDFDLTHLGDRQCQSCHAVRFDSFSHGHPEFGDYPHERRTRLQFDHSTHYGRHFFLFERLMPGGAAPESCGTCHVPDPAGQIMLVRGFEAACAACHARQIEERELPGVAFVRLPAVDVETLGAGGFDVGEWPARPNGASPPFLELLLAADPDYLAARKTLGGIPLDHLDEADADQLEAAATIVQSVKRLILDLVTRREEALEERFVRVLSDKVDPAHLRELTAGPTHGPEFFDVLTFAQQIWLPHLTVDSDAPNSPDESDDGPGAAVNADLTFGNWYLDSRDQSLRFRPAGHADPLMSDWIEISATAAGRVFQASAAQRNALQSREMVTERRTQSALAEMLEQMADPESAGRCMKCHTLDREADGGLTVNWRGVQPAQTYRRFTRFSHTPHLTHGDETGGCDACHTVDTDFDLQHPEFFHSDWSLKTNPHSRLTSGLQPVARQGCVECHTSARAAENCLTCHNYHVGQFLPVARTSP